ncbi:MAG TPA: S8/S53 family peptidase [Streptosporangiaceae bacterium]|nr:S8/S53 family peptidase [Streptosporangiaceae bacterium]
MNSPSEVSPPGAAGPGPGAARPAPAERAEVQARLLQENHAATGAQVAIARRADGSIDYLYRAGEILVRDAYLERVRAALSPTGGGGGPLGPGDAGLIEGVTLLSLAPYPYDVPGALDLIDAQVGEWVATPNHMLSITPVHTCPPNEPDPEPPQAPPDPGICDTGGSGVIIYVPDTGLLAGAAEAHPWLAGVTGPTDHLIRGTIPGYAGHGTFVAGVARCMAPSSTVRVNDDFTAGGARSEASFVLRLGQALSLGADIISLSAGGCTRKDLPLLSFSAFWHRYRDYKNVVMVASAGNNSSRRPFWPAAFPEVVSVGALAANWRSRAWFSDYGPWIDVYAPGENLINAYATGLYTYREPPRTDHVAHFHGMARWSGTSFATPLVAGLMAARMTRTGETGRQAARSLLGFARTQHLPSVGPVLRPCDLGGSGAGGSGAGESGGSGGCGRGL